MDRVSDERVAASSLALDTVRHALFPRCQTLARFAKGQGLIAKSDRAAIHGVHPPLLLHSFKPYLVLRAEMILTFDLASHCQQENEQEDRYLRLSIV